MRRTTSAIGFNCTDYKMVSAFVMAAEITKTPLIVMLYPEQRYKNKATNLAPFVGMFNGIAENNETPIALHLDHCNDF